MSNKAKENKVSHPSYGTLAFRRRSGGATVKMQQDYF